MATFISTFIKSALFLSILSFMFWYFFPQMLDSFIFHMSDYFSMRSFFSTLISSTIIASVVSFIVGNIFPKVLESFLSYMFDRFFPELFAYIFSWMAERAPTAIRLATMRIMESKAQQSTLAEVWGCLRGEPAVGIIGLYGPGGVGKTTLLKQINNKFCDESNGFEVVIWVVVSNNPNVENLREEIGKRIDCSDAQTISDTLAKKKFVLLLDDIWKWIDLTELGVPIQSLQSTGSKIVFTTRQQDVCDSMKSKTFQVKCLADDEAWKLFQETVGNDTLSDPSIVKEAKIMYKECKGLPLALITIGRAMCSKKRTQEWRAAIRKIRTSTSKISGMEEVYSRLKFSYDSLSEDTTRSCLLYCSLFPEDYKIPRRDLIDCWIGEGFLEEYDDGYSIVGELVRACLLEEEEDEVDDHVKMHDVIRDMALWIAKEEKKNFLVEAGGGLTRSPEVEKWKGIKRLSLMENKITSLQAGSLMYPDLVTLFLNHNDLREITDDFFQSMSSLKVLNLSFNSRLTMKFSLGISKLVSLQYLDLSMTRIRELPEALGSLVNLKCLKAESANRLCTIPNQLISKFEKLKVLRIILAYGPISEPRENNVLYGGGELLVKELVHLKELNALSLTLKSFHALEIFLGSHKLKSCTQSLDLCRFNEPTTLNISFLKNMENLDRFYIRSCNSLKFIEMGFADKISIETHGFHNIQVVMIGFCRNLHDLTWLILAPNLKKLRISQCDYMEEIINIEKLNEVQKMTGNLNPFEKLQFLVLTEMSRLQCIYQNALPFPHLKDLCVALCPNIKKLPLDSNTTKNRQINIYGKEDWWKKLQWEGEATKNAFLPCYKGFYRLS